jgi:NTP pyrophosphatase (non-canonical NTP hydrolase)
MKDLQDRIKKFCEENNMKCSSEARMLDLVSEIGEVSKAILKSSKYGKQETTITDNFKEELGDTLFSLICLANQFDIDLKNETNLILEKYQKRISEKGFAGSGQ